MGDPSHINYIRRHIIPYSAFNSKPFLGFFKIKSSNNIMSSPLLNPQKFTELRYFTIQATEKRGSRLEKN